jgi:pyruvate/2-oxoglutarate dehydrogenase complex dihydrolipoamide acyltransferase (E2) component
MADEERPTNQRSMRQIALGVAVLIATGIIAWQMTESDNLSSDADLAVAVAPSSTAERPPATEAPAPTATASAKPKRQTRLDWSRAAVEKRRAAWEKKRQAIRLAREKRRAEAKANTTTAAEKEAAIEAYRGKIQDAMQEMLPLIKECYTNALEDQPELEGKLVLNYTISGDEDVGGIVEESEIDGDRSDDIGDSEALVQCITETIYTIDIDPPPGGETSISYPIVFSAGDDDDDDDDGDGDE